MVYIVIRNNIEALTKPKPKVVNNSPQQIPPQTNKSFIENLVGGIPLEMIAIPAGSFWMGSTEEEVIWLCAEFKQDWFKNEFPQHQVNLTSFYTGKYPITQAQWAAVAALPKIKYDLESQPSCFEGNSRPVEYVSWLDAVEFCQRLSSYTTKNYKLPTEAQWEYACRAGTTTSFYFGETISTEQANYDGNFVFRNGKKGINRGETTEVGTFPANGFGLCDMHGNVWEWCEDDYHDNYQGAPKDGEAWVSNNYNDNQENFKVMRGGSWVSNPQLCRSANSFWDIADVRSDDIGFRVVCFP